jgi:hypothetical protein
LSEREDETMSKPKKTSTEAIFEAVRTAYTRPEDAKRFREAVDSAATMLATPAADALPPTSNNARKCQEAYLQHRNALVHRVAQLLGIVAGYDALLAERGTCTREGLNWGHVGSLENFEHALHDLVDPDGEKGI